MKKLFLSRYALSSCAAAAMLAGCGGSQPPIGAPGAMPQVSALAARTNSKNYKVLYSFGASPDGNYPPRGKLDRHRGLFYGTTQAAQTVAVQVRAGPSSASPRAARKRYCTASVAAPMAFSPSRA